MDEPEDYYPSVSPYVEISGKKIEAFWKGFTNNLKQSNLPARLIPIIMDIGIQVYVNSLLHLKINSTTLDRIAFEKKIQILIDMGILDEKLGLTLKKLAEIRNICGHQIDIPEIEINKVLDSIGYDVGNKENDSYDLKYKRHSAHAINQLTKIYDDVVKDSIEM